MQAANQIRQQHPNANTWFENDFNAKHNLNPYYNRLGWQNGWATSGWATTAAWAGLEAASGGGYPAYYYDDSGSYGVLPANQAYTYAPPEQNINIALQTQAAAPQASTQNTPQTAISSTPKDDWLPLGIFAIGSSAETAPYSNMVMQLALNKQGYISGTFYNAGTDKTYPIEGSIDKITQQAIWKMSNNSESPVARTGLYNLTQDIAPIQVYFPSSAAEQPKVLVRVKQ